MISVAQEEVEKWATLKKFLRGEFSKLTYGQVSDAGKIADCFVLSENGYATTWDDVGGLESQLRKI